MKSSLGKSNKRGAEERDLASEDVSNASVCLEIAADVTKN